MIDIYHCMLQGWKSVDTGIATDNNPESYLLPNGLSYMAQSMR